METERLSSGGDSQGSLGRIVSTGIWIWRVLACPIRMLSIGIIGN